MVAGAVRALRAAARKDRSEVRAGGMVIELANRPRLVAGQKSADLVS